MLIGEAARRSGVPARTLRYYEARGLLEPPHRTTSGYRDFDESVLDRLAFVRSARAVGLTLDEIGSVVSLRDDGVIPCAHVVDLLEGHVDDIRRALRELRVLEAELVRLVERASGLDPADCDPRSVCHVIQHR